MTETPLRTWYFKGETLVSPNWVQNKKPFIINAEIRADYFKTPANEPLKIPVNKKLGFWQRLLSALTPQTSNNYSNQQSSYDDTEQNINEDSKGDFLALDEPDLIFSEEE